MAVGPWNGICLFDEVDSRELREWYNCEGRNSVPFSGVYKGLWRAVIGMRMVLFSISWTGVRLSAKDKATLDYVMSSCETGGEAEDIIQEGFRQRGDLGSLLFNRRGQVCGRYYRNSVSLVGPGKAGGLKMNAGVATLLRRHEGEVWLGVSMDDI